MSNGRHQGCVSVCVQFSLILNSSLNKDFDYCPLVSSLFLPSQLCASMNTFPPVSSKQVWRETNLQYNTPLQQTGWETWVKLKLNSELFWREQNLCCCVFLNKPQLCQRLSPSERQQRSTCLLRLNIFKLHKWALNRLLHKNLLKVWFEHKRLVFRV